MDIKTGHRYPMNSSRNSDRLNGLENNVDKGTNDSTKMAQPLGSKHRKKKLDQS